MSRPVAAAPPLGSWPAHWRRVKDLTSHGQRFASAAGGAYTTAALLGFILTGFTDFLSERGEMLAFLELNPAQNTIHFLLGTLWLASASAGRAVRTANLTFGLILSAISVFGFLTGIVGTNPLALNLGDNLFHLITGGSAVAFAYWAGPRNKRPDPTALSSDL